ncbi:sugar transferase [Phycicoccus sp. 3266]|uniref:sugar transferase n=1 Tax=Phycicoccus sp. 3266 TaxID=2817751 RepID=UPI00285882F9|nr:sugar transferase [Phycicoccus sp. 3266]MDR6864147.1 lipopolysaccharide/colanic/teichoic acid biosynthesis glycosyltransferase [Phycicoccus sp. 3266]
MKRAFDVAVAGLVLLLLWPVMVLLAVLIRATSPGPAFFRQERVGLHGELFRIHKFRTLRTGPAGTMISPTGDPRITRVGAVLRRTKLDELPQLLDVLAGTMSLVGPRPEVPAYAALWPAEYRDVILSVRPGITDPASVAFRDEPERLAAVADPEAYYVSVLLPEKARMYAEYVRGQSFLGDLVVLGRTARAVAVG